MSYMTDMENEQYLPLRETVYYKLRKQILTGELKPGERLLEIQLASKLDVSRTPIREAIRKLENEGLVRIIPRSGAQVAKISEKELKDVLEVRRSLDALSAELACVRIDEEGKAQLEKHYEAFVEAARTGNSVKIAEADVSFHNVIIQSTGNNRLIEILHNLADQMYRYRFEYIKEDMNYERLISEHRTLVDSIFAGDRAKAREMAILHVDHQEETILAQLRREA